MPAPIPTLLNPSIGILGLLQMPDTGRLPPAKELASSLLQESSLESLYGPVNSRTAFEAFLCPNVSDGRVVSPEVFSEDLQALVAILQKSTNPKVQALVNEEILPLLQNGMLLSAYRGLMLGG